ncbi:hypothetical protein [Paenibacillus sp.]|jgi:SagB-type dehydrogenase family enzyme|uniref:hypothetical protein n=1 Tax=Paenibacillus sp. TaxID=58172 RepID=UPI0028188ACD|nr:hypothetical protein [Paenibacillus sp.]MDR0267856.1 hypothetical protein [Paenibacillus sp.]
MKDKERVTLGLETNTIERSFNDYIYERSMPKKIENFILKFHQASTYLIHAKGKNDVIDNNVFNWLTQVERTDVRPEYYEKKIDLNYLPINLEIKGSFREYQTDRNLNLEEISLLLNSSFGRDENTKSKRYGSAGGLYPVIPILMILKPFDDLECGSYVYDSEHKCLLKIKSWTVEESVEIKKELSKGFNYLPNTCIAYAVDIRRAILKYHIRGYRHALIEVGAMSQVFKESLHNLNENFGEVSWSGFNDNQLSHACGLNARLCPILLVQWFGRIK